MSVIFSNSAIFPACDSTAELLPKVVKPLPVLGNDDWTKILTSPEPTSRGSSLGNSDNVEYQHLLLLSMFHPIHVIQSFHGVLVIQMAWHRQYLTRGESFSIIKRTDEPEIVSSSNSSTHGSGSDPSISEDFAYQKCPVSSST